MKPALVYNKNLEILGVIHNWRVSVATGEMNPLSNLCPDIHIGKAFHQCMRCKHLDRCFPRLLIKLPNKEVA